MNLAGLARPPTVTSPFRRLYPAGLRKDVALNYSCRDSANPERSSHDRGLRIRRPWRGAELSRGADQGIRSLASRRRDRDRRGALVKSPALLRQLPQISRGFSPSSPTRPLPRPGSRDAHPDVELDRRGPSENIASAADWDGILSINVLEHIDGDDAELARFTQSYSLGPSRSPLSFCPRASRSYMRPSTRTLGIFAVTPAHHCGKNLSPPVL